MEPLRGGLDYEGAAVLVTGASRGLGAALASELAARGARVVAVARGREALREVTSRIEAGGGRALPVDGDIGDPRDVERIAAAVHEAFGALDLLIHNAAALGPAPLPLLLDLDPDHLGAVLRTNVVGMHRLSRRLIGPMVLRGRGTVAAISSDAAIEAYPGWGAYGASKAAQDHLMRTFAAELGGQGIRFVEIDPGEMDTEMHRAALPDADRSALADPAEVAHWIADRLAVGGPLGSRLVRGQP